MFFLSPPHLLTFASTACHLHFYDLSSFSLDGAERFAPTCRLLPSLTVCDQAAGCCQLAAVSKDILKNKPVTWQRLGKANKQKRAALLLSPLYFWLLRTFIFLFYTNLAYMQSVQNNLGKCKQGSRAGVINLFLICMCLLHAEHSQLHFVNLCVPHQKVLLLCVWGEKKAIQT